MYNNKIKTMCTQIMKSLYSLLNNFLETKNVVLIKKTYTQK